MPMSLANTYYKQGEWNMICQSCGFKKKSGELKKRWDGLWVCADEWETRHPQDFIKTPNEDTSVPYTAPEQADVINTDNTTTRKAAL